jgi:hypothetical protein
MSWRALRHAISPPLASREHRRGTFPAQIPIAEPAARPTEPYLPRFRALALFGRRPPERVVRASSPASENLHRAQELTHAAQQDALYRLQTSIVSRINVICLSVRDLFFAQGRAGEGVLTESRGRLRHTFKVARLGHEAAKTVNEIGRRPCRHRSSGLAMIELPGVIEIGFNSAFHMRCL